MKKFFLVLFLLIGGVTYAQYSQPGGQTIGKGYTRPVVLYDADAIALFGRMSTPPTTAEMVRISNLITWFKLKGVWTGFDGVVGSAAETSQAGLLNWKGNVYNSTFVGTPTFTTNQGFTTGTTNALNTQFAPSINGSQFTQNSCSFGVYSRTSGVTAGADFGALDGVGKSINVSNAFSDGTMYYRFVNANASFGTVASTNGSGLFHYNRSSSTAIQVYRNGSVFTTGSITSATLPGIVIYVGALNNSGVLNTVAPRQYAFYYWGRSFTAQEVADINTGIEAYLDSKSSGVQ